MTSFEPELWVQDPGAAIAFYTAAFGARVEHQVGDDTEIVARLAIGDARFWVSNASGEKGRFSPETLGGATGRVLMVADDPDAVAKGAVAAGACELSAVADDHGWRLGRVRDPFGHEWEIGRPLEARPPREAD